MKISKSLLQAMVIGATLATATACEKINIQKELGDNNATEECGTMNPSENPDAPENCPACGMG